MAEKKEFEGENYKFPDENQEAAGDDLQIDIVDDTPEEDRGRTPLPKQLVEELESDDLQEYSEKVRNRLKQMKKVWHDERREKERADREREEAISLAQRIMDENKQLKSRLGKGEQLLLQEGTKAATSELNIAKDRLKKALDSGDADEITEAQEALTDAKLRLRDINRFKPSLQESEDGVEEGQQTAPPRRVADPKAETWRDQNTWFGADEEMTALALGLHEKLVRTGVDPRSDDYYRRIDDTMRKRFPDYEWEDAEESGSRRSKPAPRARAATTVAPARRSTAPRQVTLTPSQVAIAKRLGLTPEAYARELIKVENSNG